MENRIKKLEHYVMGFVFNTHRNKVLLIEKRRPDWMAGRWNGIGGHIEKGETPYEAIVRECNEETGYKRIWKHKITFICPGGTVFVYATDSHYNKIPFEQIEDEILKEFYIEHLPDESMSNIRAFIPLCLMDIATPLMITQNQLGTD